MEPTHKFNNGNGATLCKSCRKIIVENFTNDLLCTDCQLKALELLDKVDTILDFDPEDYTDGQVLDEILKLEIDNFLKQIDDEES